MAFNYTRYLPQLETFHHSMLHIGRGVEIGTFDFTYNNIFSHVIFDTRNDWKLVFLHHGTGDILRIPVIPRYRFQIASDEKYREFLDYFQIKNRGKGQFSISAFINNMTQHIPERYVLNNQSRLAIERYDPIDRRNPGIYPIGIINWEENHALHPEWPDGLYHRSDENLEKTKQYWPEIYEVIVDMDISVRYGQNPGVNTDRLTEGLL